MSNVAGLSATLKALKGRIRREDEALVEAAKGLALAVDDDPGNAALWREYRAAVATILESAGGGETDEYADLLASIRTPGVRAGVGNAQKP